MRRAIVTIAAVILTAGTLSAVTHGKTIYVDAGAAGANNGTTWADAYKFLQDALTDANSSEKPVEIRVAQGVYKPDRSGPEPNGTGDREATFQLISGVTLKGGYAGFGQPDPNARDIELYETILSGDLESNDDVNDIDVLDPCDLLNRPSRAENSYHVSNGSRTDATAVMDGLIITGGNANLMKIPPGPHDKGGGMYNDSGNPTLIHCTFSNNGAYYGGAMYNGCFNTCIRPPCPGPCQGGSPTLTNSIFSNNSAGLYGGGMFNYNSSSTLISCIFSRNSAEWRGSGMFNAYNNPTVINCILWDNSDSQIEGPTSVIYSNIEGGWPGVGNIDADPCFVAVGYWDPNGTPADANDDYFVEGDYHLKSQAGRWDPVGKQWVKDKVTSPCIDAGDPRSPIGYEPFPNGGRINMGAYGGTAEASKSYFGKPPCEVIVAGDVNGDCRVDYLDAALMFGNWLDTRALVAACPNPPDGAVGIRTNPVLSWEAGIGATSHDVYFGTSSPGTFQRNQTETTFTPGRLSETTTYYWRIDEVSARGKTIGNVWQFATTIDGGTR